MPSHLYGHNRLKWMEISETRGRGGKKKQRKEERERWGMEIEEGPWQWAHGNKDGDESIVAPTTTYPSQVRPYLISPPLLPHLHFSSLSLSLSPSYHVFFPSNVTHEPSLLLKISTITADISVTADILHDIGRCKPIFWQFSGYSRPIPVHIGLL